MKLKLKFNLYSFVFLLLNLFNILLMVGCTTAKPTNDFTSNNFYQVSADVYRSGQPSKAEKQIEAFGIKTVINLRAIHSDRDEIEGTKLNYYWVRMRAGKITDKTMIKVLKLINESAKPILVHCWHGSDRTGVVIAMYRMVFQDWSKQQAIDELMQPEYGHHYNYYSNIAEYIKNVDIEQIKQQVFR